MTEPTPLSVAEAREACLEHHPFCMALDLRGGFDCNCAYPKHAAKLDALIAAVRAEEQSLAQEAS